MKADYSGVTEAPNVGASPEQLAMLLTRYKFASEFCHNKDVLEVACGAGLGLGYLEPIAKKVVGGDIDETNLYHAKTHYKNRPNIELKKLDAHELPFDDKSFDVIILFEAIYYLKDPDRFLSECRRVLRGNGTILICSVNREWSDFNPSPFSVRYFSATELSELLKKNQFQVELFGGFATNQKSFSKKIISFIKRAAVSFHLIPKTMKGKEFLKRIFFGKLTPLPPEISEEMATYARPIEIKTEGLQSDYKVIYAKGSLR